MGEHPFGVPTAVGDFHCGRCGTLLDGGTDEPVAARELRKERDLYRWALNEIATRPTTELNPDGIDQAAWSMQLIAQEVLGLPSESSGGES